MKTLSIIGFKIWIFTVISSKFHNSHIFSIFNTNITALNNVHYVQKIITKPDHHLGGFHDHCLCERGGLRGGGVRMFHSNTAEMFKNKVKSESMFLHHMFLFSYSAEQRRAVKSLKQHLCYFCEGIVCTFLVFLFATVFGAFSTSLSLHLLLLRTCYLCCSPFMVLTPI